MYAMLIHFNFSKLFEFQIYDYKFLPTQFCYLQLIFVIYIVNDLYKKNIVNV